VFNLGIGYSQRLTGDLNAFDAKAIAVTPFRVAGGEAEGYWVISSPNTYWVPTVMIGVREVFLRADGRFAWEDRTLWPQFYSFGFHYIACIPRKPHDPSGKNPLSILWWTPQPEDFISVVGSDVDVVLGRLPEDRIVALKYWRDLLVTEVRAYQASHPRDTLLGLLDTSMRHAFLRLTIAPMTRRQMTEHVPNFQRFCLDVRALLDFFLIYSPRLTAPDEETADLPVELHLMGACTEDETVVLELVKMKIPVWHVRPSYKLFPNMNIRQVVHLSTPRDLVTRNYQPVPFPILCKQSPGSLRLQATQHVGASCINLFKDVSSMPDPPTATETTGVRPAPRMSFSLL
jgi:hypothetical protein